MLSGAMSMHAPASHEIAAGVARPGGLLSGVAEFTHRLRAGEATAECATVAYLERIEKLNPRLGAFVHVDEAGAVATARGIDRSLRAGVDPGPLAGLAVAVKDVIAVDGMPTKAGSRVNVGDMINTEGAFVQMLRRAGCIIIGKTATVEFALGAGPHAGGTPWNPRDMSTHRIPGGSSSGSAVAVAAGLCAFALGTDTGGSVRIPATLCGVAGNKPTHGLWPLSGTLPVAPTFDTMGLLAPAAADIAFIQAALQGVAPVALPDLRSLILGRPRKFFSEHVDEPVVDCVNAALAKAQERGVTVVDVDFPEAEAARNYALIVPTEFLNALSRDRFATVRDDLDPDVAGRIASALDVPYGLYEKRKQELPAIRFAAAKRFNGIAAIVTPTAPLVAKSLADFDDASFARSYHHRITDKTRPANVLDLCAVTIPITEPKSTLPVGLQVICQRSEDDKVLAIACALENCLNDPADARAGDTAT